MSNRTEFEPEKLRVVGRLSWMKDGDQGHWFSVPSSNDQLIFSEDGVYAHSLTGVQIEIFEIHSWYGSYPEIHAWDGSHPSGEDLKFSGLVEKGEQLYTALVDGGFEFWSGDPDALFQWKKFRTVFADDQWNFSVISRAELARRQKAMETSYRNREKDDRNKRTEAAAPGRELRDALRTARDQWRTRSEYDSIFAAVYGKSQASLNETDPKEVVYHAHAIVEYRLRLGKWDLQQAS